MSVEDYSTLSEAEVGDRVIDLYHGEGKIVAINPDRNYQLSVEFKDGHCQSYNLEGQALPYNSTWPSSSERRLIMQNKPKKPTFKDAKIGDRVWSILHGWGVIKDVIVDDSDENTYPLEVAFDHKGSNRSYTYDGKHYNHEVSPTLFWQEFDLPKFERPKRKVQKQIDGWVNLYDGDIVGYKFYRSRTDADNNAREDRIDCVYLSGSYTVEE